MATATQRMFGRVARRTRSGNLVVGMGLSLVLACAPAPEPGIAPPSPLQIPWLDAGTPPIAPPEIPWLEDASACPDGWTWVDLDGRGHHGCSPYPMGYEDDCGPTAAHFPGEPTCRELGTGETEWPRDLPPLGVLYVRAGETGGDGSRDRPFGTLHAAIAAAAPGSVIALAPGRYVARETLELDRIAFRGTSASNTFLSPVADGGTQTVLRLRGEGLQIEDLTVTGNITLVGGQGSVQRLILRELGQVVADGALAPAHLRAEDVAARAVEVSGLLATGRGAQMEVARAVFVEGSSAGIVSVAEARIRVADVTVAGGDSAVLAASGGLAEVRRVASLRAAAMAGAFDRGRLEARWAYMDVGLQGGAVNVLTGGTATLQDAAIVSAEAHSRTVLGSVDETAHLRLDRAVFASAGRGCIVLAGDADLSDVLCAAPTGIAFVSGSVGRLTRVRVEISGTSPDVSVYGLHAGSAAHVVATDFSVEPSGGGVGIWAYTGGVVEVGRAAVREGVTGMLAQAGGTIDAHDVFLGDLSTPVLGFIGVGALAGNSGTVRLERAVVDGVRGEGLRAYDSGHIDALDVVVRNFEGLPGQPAGAHVFADGSSITLERTDIGPGHELGLWVSGEAELQDVVVHDIEAEAAEAIRGIGLLAVRPAGLNDDVPVTSVEASRLFIHDVASEGVRLQGQPLRPREPALGATLADVRIEHVIAPVCPFEDCETGSVGVYATGAVEATLARTSIRDVVSAGVLVRDGASVEVVDGYIERAAVCASTPSADATDRILSMTATSACASGEVAWTPVPF